MKTYAYFILAVIVASFLLQPLSEVMMVCRDVLVVNRAANDAVRSAKKESYIYEDMRDAKTGIDEEIFKEEFSEIFQTAVGLEKTSCEHFVPKNRDLFNDFYVEYDFDTERKGDRTQINVTVSVKSEYKFKTKWLKEAEDVIRNGPGIFDLTYKRKHNLIMVN